MQQSLQRDLFGRRRVSVGPQAGPAPLTPREAWLRVLRHRGWVVLLAVVVSLSIGALIALCRQPQFAALEEIEVLPATDVAMGAPVPAVADAATVGTVAEELRSDSLIAEALKRMPAAEAGALTDPPVRWPTWLRSEWKWLSEPQGIMGRAEAVDRRLELTSSAKSRLIRLRFIADSPALAASFLVQLDAAYARNEQMRHRSQEGERVDYLQAETAAERRRVEAAAAQLQEVADQDGIEDPSSKLAAANRRWQELEDAEIQAEITAVKPVDELRLPRTGGTTAGVPDGLLVTRAEQAGEVQRLSEIYKQGAAPLEQAEHELAAIDAGVRELKNSDRSSRELALAAAREQASELRKKLEAQVADQFLLEQRIGRFDLAERPLEAERTAYAHLLDDLQEAIADENATVSSIAVSSPPVAAARRVAPRYSSALLAALFGGLAVGLVAAWQWEKSEDRLDWRAAERMGASIIAALPPERPGRPAWSNSSVAAYLPEQFQNAIEGCAAALMLARSENGTRSVLVCSPSGGDGKTSVALHLGARLARLGIRVLVIDGHGRRPALHTALGLPLRPGLGDLFSGRAEMEAALCPRPAGTFRPAAIAAGAICPDHCLHLAGGAASQILAATLALFDWVIVDGPAASEGPEAGLWALAADCTLVVARAQVTRASRLRQTISDLSSMGVCEVGLVLNGVYGRPALMGWPGRIPSPSRCQSAGVARLGA